MAEIEQRINSFITGKVVRSEDGDDGKPGHIEGVVVPIGVVQKISSFWDSFDEMMGDDLVVSKNHGKLFLEHNDNIGTQSVVRTENAGQMCLFGSGDITLDSSRGHDAYALVKSGALDGISIGFVPIRVEFINAEDRTDVVDAQRDLKIYHEIEIYEFSLVSFPAYGDKTPVTKVRSQGPEPQETTTREDADMPQSQGEQSLTTEVRALVDAISAKKSNAAEERSINKEKASFARKLNDSGLDATRKAEVIDKVEHSANPDEDAIIKDAQERQDEIKKAVEEARSKWESERKGSKTEDVRSQNAEDDPKSESEERSETFGEDGNIWLNALGGK